MRKLLYKNGPIVVAINTRAMKHLIGGILSADGRYCSRQYETLKHAVVLIGYGFEIDTSTGNEVQFWIAKTAGEWVGLRKVKLCISMQFSTIILLSFYFYRIFSN